MDYLPNFRILVTRGLCSTLHEKLEQCEAALGQGQNDQNDNAELDRLRIQQYTVSLWDIPYDNIHVYATCYCWNYVYTCTYIVHAPYGDLHMCINIFVVM